MDTVWEILTLKQVVRNNYSVLRDWWCLRLHKLILNVRKELHFCTLHFKIHGHTRYNKS